jgi:hypothetical protein
MTMKIRCIIGWATFAASLACSGAWAWDQDPAAQYFERKDTIVSGAGDAKNVNAATHIIDPWPRYVGNRRIPMNGERAAGAAGRVRRNTPWETPCPIQPVFDIQTRNIFTQTDRGCAINRVLQGAGSVLQGAAAGGAPVDVGVGIGIGGGPSR